MNHGSSMPREGLVSNPDPAHEPVLLTPIDYPFIATADGDFVALRAIVRLCQRDGVWTAVLLDGERHELETAVARTILDQGPFDRAYVPSALLDSLTAPQGAPFRQPPGLVP